MINIYYENIWSPVHSNYIPVSSWSKGCCSAESRCSWAHGTVSQSSDRTRTCRDHCRCTWNLDNIEKICWTLAGLLQWLGTHWTLLTAVLERSRHFSGQAWECVFHSFRVSIVDSLLVLIKTNNIDHSVSGKTIKAILNSHLRHTLNSSLPQRTVSFWFPRHKGQHRFSSPIWAGRSWWVFSGSLELECSQWRPTLDYLQRIKDWLSWRQCMWFYFSCSKCK